MRIVASSSKTGNVYIKKINTLKQTILLVPLIRIDRVAHFRCIGGVGFFVIGFSTIHDAQAVNELHVFWSNRNAFGIDRTHERH